jgi:hypothetical protein
MTRAATALSVLAALALTVFSVVRGTWAAGGSDSSCYALMAEAFARGAVQPQLPLADEAPWSDATLTLAPAGFIPSPVRSAAASPVCAPGFSLLMVPFRWLLGRDGIFLLTPVAAGLLVWCAAVIARRLANAIAGALAAIVVGTSPIVLFQAVQPMNDIMTAMLWSAVVAVAAGKQAHRGLLLGALTGLAVLVRPNLAPVAAVVVLWSLVESRALFGHFLLASAPLVALAALLNWLLYGHPLRVGYGSAADLFSVSYLPANAAHYGRALIETQTPFPLLALACQWLVRRDQRRVVWLALGIVAVTIAVYLAYRPFDEWWYLRFLLPALTIAIALASAAAATVFARRPVVVAALACALAVFGLRTAGARDVFELQHLEARFRNTGEFVAERLPPNAVFFAVWQSGTLRFYAGREAIVWDSLAPAQFDPAAQWLRERGLVPFVLVERWEEPRFRERFGGASAFAALDWPPRYEIDRLVRIYALDDRDAYLAGRPVGTEYIWPVTRRLLPLP